MSEPRYLLLGIDPAKVEMARDENELMLTAVPSDQTEWYTMRLARLIRRERASDDEAVPFESDIRLQRTNAKGKTIKQVRGSLPVNVVVARKDVVATEKFLESKGTTARIGNDNLEILVASQSEKGDYFNLEIRVPKQEDFSLHWHDRIHLEDAKGHRLKSTSRGYGNVGEKYWVDFGYPKPDDPDVGPPVKVVIEDWTIVRHPIPFAFKDVPLP
jgi:hypothetical protein